MKKQGCLEIPEKHDIRKQGTYEKVKGSEGFRKDMIFEKAAHPKKRGYPEIPENHDIRKESNGT